MVPNCQLCHQGGESMPSLQAVWGLVSLSSSARVKTLKHTKTLLYPYWNVGSLRDFFREALLYSSISRSNYHHSTQVRPQKSSGRTFIHSRTSSSVMVDRISWEKLSPNSQRVPENARLKRNDAISIHFKREHEVFNLTKPGYQGRSETDAMGAWTCHHVKSNRFKPVLILSVWLKKGSRPTSHAQRAGSSGTSLCHDLTSHILPPWHFLLTELCWGWLFNP